MVHSWKYWDVSAPKCNCHTVEPLVASESVKMNKIPSSKYPWNWFKYRFL